MDMQASNAEMLALKQKVQMLESQLLEKQADCNGAFAQVRELQETLSSSVHRSASLEASNERTQLLEKQVGVLHSALESVRAELQVARRMQLEYISTTGVRPAPEDLHEAFVKDLKIELAHVKAERDAVLLRTKWLEFLVLDLIDQLSLTSVLASDLFEDAMQQAHDLHYRHRDHEVGDRANLALLAREREDLEAAILILQRDKELAEKNADRFYSELLSMRHSMSARSSVGAGDSVGDWERNQSVISPLAVQLLHDEMQQTVVGHDVMLRKVDELVRMLAETSTACEESELKCQKLLDMKINTELELNECNRKLSEAVAQNQHLHHLCETEKADILRSVAGLCKELADLDTEVAAFLYNPQLYQPRDVSEAPHSGFWQERSHQGSHGYTGKKYAEASMMSPRGSLGGVTHGLYLVGKELLQSQPTAENHDSRGVQALSPPGVDMLSPRCGSTENGVISGATPPTSGAVSQVQGMAVFLDLQVSTIDDMLRFQQELLDDLAWAADVDNSQLQLMRIEQAGINNMQIGPVAPNAWTNFVNSTSCVVAEIKVLMCVGSSNGETSTRSKSSAHIVRTLAEQVPLPQSLLRMGVHSSSIMRITPILAKFAPVQASGLVSPPQLNPCRTQRAAVTALSPPLCPPGGGVETQLVARVKEELQEQLNKVKDWARVEVSRERRLNLQLQQQLQQASNKHRDVLECLEVAQAEARSERRDHARFVSVYLRKVRVLFVYFLAYKSMSSFLRLGLAI
jgi:hypothetical protein